MKKKTSFIIILIFISFCFIVLFKGLNKSNIYVPSATSGKQLLSFDAKKLFNDEQINSNILFGENKVYLLNICSFVPADQNYYKIHIGHSGKSYLRYLSFRLLFRY